MEVVNNWLNIAVGVNHTIATKTDGTLWAWGNNSNGQLGDGTIIQRNSPIQIGNSNNWLKVAAGSSRSYAIKTDGDDVGLG